MIFTWLVLYVILFFSNELKLIFCIQMVSSIADSNSFICTHLNWSHYRYYIPIIQFLHTFKWFQVFLFNTNNIIKHYSSVYTVKRLHVLLCNTNELIYHKSFLSTQLNGQRVLSDPQSVPGSNANEGLLNLIQSS